MLDTSVLSLLVRLVVSLTIVIGLMVLLAAALRKRGIAMAHPKAAARRGGPTSQVEVLARKGLGRNAQVAVVRAAGRTMVLGVTEHQVTMLGDAEIDLSNVTMFPTGVQGTDIPGSADGPSGTPWKMMLDTVRAKTVRH